MTKPFLVLLIMIMGLLSLMGTAAEASKADSHVETSTPQSEFSESIKQVKTELELQEEKQRQVLDALYALNVKIKKTVLDRAEFNHKKAFLEVSIKDLELKKKELDLQIAGQRGQLAERLRALYKLKSGSMAQFLFSSQSSAELDRNLKVLGIVTAYDAELMKNYLIDIKNVEKKEKSIRDKIIGLELVDKKLVNKEAQFKKEQALKSQILRGIRHRKLFAKEKIDELRRSNKNISDDEVNLIEMILKPSFFEQQGKLTGPLSGVVAQKFGLIKDKDHSYTLFNKGILIVPGSNSEVKAVFDGKISFAGVIPHSGKTVIVDHGDHYYTVYSGLNELLTKEGAEIQEQSTIGRSSELYFEVRHFSEPYDPQQWMKGLYPL